MLPQAGRASTHTYIWVPETPPHVFLQGQCWCQDPDQNTFGNTVQRLTTREGNAGSDLVHLQIWGMGVHVTSASQTLLGSSVVTHHMPSCGCLA